MEDWRSVSPRLAERRHRKSVGEVREKKTGKKKKNEKMELGQNKAKRRVDRPSKLEASFSCKICYVPPLGYT